MEDPELDIKRSDVLAGFVREEENIATCWMSQVGLKIVKREEKASRNTPRL